MNAEWIVTTLTLDDYGAIRDLWEQSGLPTKPGGRDSRAEFAKQFAGHTQTVIGVMAGDRLIGVVVATHDGRKGWINRLAVHPEFRHQGVARHLIAEAERTLHAQGMHIVAALIEDWNTPSLALFQSAGYIDYPDIHYVTKRESPDV